MKDILPVENSKNDAFNKIVRFYIDGDVALSADEEKILNRWIFCDALLRQRKHKTDYIIAQLGEKFGVSKFTAQNDITQTYALFGQTRIMSKQYLISHHIEDIQQQIERYKFDKSLAQLLPKLYAELTRAINSLPDGAAKPPSAPPTVVISTIVQQAPAATLSLEEAKEKLAAWKANKAAKEFDDFEDVTNEQ